MKEAAVTDFRTFELERSGLLFESGAIRMLALSQETIALNGDAAYWVLVIEGTVDARLHDHHYAVIAGHYLATPGAGTLQGGRALVIEQLGYRNVRQLGGPLEASGRLRYVDGCSDTLLVCPPRLGEPCLNHLHIPAGTRQSAHTHPSLRIGVIARGSGTCHTPRGAIDLRGGLAWAIPAGLEHCFQTHEQSLDVLAWHPDSDFGPCDHDHPMINRTMLRERP